MLFFSAYHSIYATEEIVQWKTKKFKNTHPIPLLKLYRSSRTWKKMIIQSHNFNFLIDQFGLFIIIWILSYLKSSNVRRRNSCSQFCGIIRNFPKLRVSVVFVEDFSCVLLQHTHTGSIPEPCKVSQMNYINTVLSSTLNITVRGIAFMKKESVRWRERERNRETEITNIVRTWIYWFSVLACVCIFSLIVVFI